MLVIRLLRIGKKNQPSFKIVVTRKTNPPRGGRFVEQVGTYNPLTKEKAFNKERIKYWLSQGARPSDTFHNLLINEGVLAGEKVSLHKKSKKPAAAPAEAPAAKPAVEEITAAPAQPRPEAAAPPVEKKEKAAKAEPVQEPKKEKAPEPKKE